VYTIRVTISCIYYFVFTISFYFMHFINLSGYLAASVQIKPVVVVPIIRGWFAAYFFGTYNMGKIREF